MNACDKAQLRFFDVWLLGGAVATSLRAAWDSRCAAPLRPEVADLGRPGECDQLQFRQQRLWQSQALGLGHRPCLKTLIPLGSFIISCNMLEYSHWAQKPWHSCPKRWSQPAWRHRGQVPAGVEVMWQVRPAQHQLPRSPQVYLWPLEGYIGHGACHDWPLRPPMCLWIESDIRMRPGRRCKQGPRLLRGQSPSMWSQSTCS